MRVIPRLISALACCSSVLLPACQTITPHNRIEKNPVMFRVLSPEHQVLVQQGRICEGMTKDAVYLAWGNPNATPIRGQQEGKAYEKWVYYIYQPVMVDTVGFGSGCWHRGSWCGGGLSSSTAMVPQEAAWVMFENDIVTAWESRK